MKHNLLQATKKFLQPFFLIKKDYCDDTRNWSVYEGQCYSCKSDEVSWQSARSSCSQLGANLVTINNLGIQTFLQSISIFFCLCNSSVQSQFSHLISKLFKDGVLQLQGSKN